MKKLFAAVTMISVIIILTMMFSLFPYKAEATPAASGVVTIWTTDSNFVKSIGAPKGAGTTYLTEMKKFYEGQNATANIIDGGHLSSNSLDGTNLLWAFLPNVDFTTDDITYMRNFLATGGRIVFCGEHPGFFRTGDGYISKAVADLGGDFTILNVMHTPTSGTVTGARLATGSSLTDGLTGFYYAAAAEIAYSGAAKVVLNAPDDLPLVVDQAVGKGRITLFTDINTWDPVFNYYAGQGNNEVLFANLLLDAKTNQDIVASGGDPNAGFVLEKVETPIANLTDESTVTSGSTVTLSTVTTGAAIHYTTDGSTPTSSSTTGSAITITGAAGTNVVVKALATKSGLSDSVVATFTYTIASKAGTPTANPDNGTTVTSGSTVTLSTVTTGAAIYYTTDGSTPTSSSTTGSAITITGAAGTNVVVKALATKTGLSDSVVATFTYTIASKAGTPTANPDNGTTVTSGSTVTLSTVTTGAAIYYTTDGSTPTSSSTIIGNAITITGAAGTNVVVKAIATKTGLSDSVVATFTYTIAANPSSDHSGSSTSTPTSTLTPTPTTVTGDVIDRAGQLVKGIEAQVTVQANGSSTVSVKSSEAILLKQADGTRTTLSDNSKLGFTVEGNTVTANVVVSISTDGTIQVSNLANGTETKIAVTYDLGNGQKITIGTMDVKVGSDGKISLTSTLIDPYGIITDAATGNVIAGANVTLYYANTARNIAAGKTPDTVVALPAIAGFKPNNNADPQVSDVNGSYGFMVFPTSDYYIVATKDGYDQFKSPTISVEQAIVKLDFKMNQPKLGLTRLAGLNRVDTAIEIAKANYTTQVSNVILATAENFPDALAGSVLAYKLNAPILLIGNTEEDQNKVIAYMKDHMNTSGTVYILGGNVAVSDTVVTKVTDSGFANVTRLGGIDRYETALKIAGALDVRTGTPVVLVYGENYPDALSISSAAADMQYPIFLVQKDGMNDSVKQMIADIKPTKVYIIGLQGVISASVEDQVSKLTALDKGNIIRLGGVDRFETSLAVAQYFNLSGQNVCIATGNNFPDALAGSVYAANSNAPIILSDLTLSDDEIAYLKARKMTGVTIFGGEAVLDKAIELALSQMLAK